MGVYHLSSRKARTKVANERVGQTVVMGVYHPTQWLQATRRASNECVDQTVVMGGYHLSSSKARTKAANERRPSEPTGSGGGILRVS